MSVNFSLIRTHRQHKAALIVYDGDQAQDACGRAERRSGNEGVFVVD